MLVEILVMMGTYLVFILPIMMLTTLLHETGHYLACKILRLRIIKVNWFSWQEFKKSFWGEGITGYVSHEESLMKWKEQIVDASGGSFTAFFYLASIAAIVIVTLILKIPLAEWLTGFLWGIGLCLILCTAPEVYRIWEELRE